MPQIGLSIKASPRLANMMQESAGVRGISGIREKGAEPALHHPNRIDVRHPELVSGYQSPPRVIPKRVRDDEGGG